MEIVALGDGDIRAAKVYTVGNLSRVIQQEGRLVITQAANAANPVTIDASGFAGFGNGPTCAFYIDTSRVILNQVITFKGFQNPAVIAYNADIDMVICNWVDNVQGGQYVSCSSVILDGGSTTLPDAGTGHVAVQSSVTSSDHGLFVDGFNGTATPSNPPQPGTFYAISRSATLTLTDHEVG